MADHKFLYRCESCRYKARLEAPRSTGSGFQPSQPVGRKCPKCGRNMWYFRSTREESPRTALVSVDEYIRLSPNLKFGCWEFWHW